jgi:hypothetical protein
MGQEIVNQESKDPGKRSRLWKAEEISEILKENEVGYWKIYVCDYKI